MRSIPSLGKEFRHPRGPYLYFAPRPSGALDLRNGLMLKQTAIVVGLLALATSAHAGSKVGTGLSDLPHGVYLGVGAGASTAEADSRRVRHAHRHQRSGLESLRRLPLQPVPFCRGVLPRLRQS